jgi:WD40 repeat protein
MRARSALPTLVIAGLVAAVVGCNGRPGTDVPTGGPPAEPTDAGPSLYTEAKFPALAVNALAAGEPLVVPNATVQYEDKQVVAAEVDSRVEMMATPLEYDQAAGKFVLERRGTAPAVETVYYDPAKTYPNKDFPKVVVQFHPRDKNTPKVPFKKLSEGDTVQIGQVLCMLDDQVVQTKMEAAEAMMHATDEVQKEAAEGVRLTKEKEKLVKDQLARGAGSVSDLIDAQTTLTRFQENLAQARQTKAKSKGDFDEAVVMLGKHKVKSSVNGIVRTIGKRPGEFAKSGEKLLEVQSTDRVRVEGNVDVQFYGTLRDMLEKKQGVTVEPAVPLPPARSHAEHRQEITGVAVTGHPARPLVVSASSDGSALVWDPNLTGEAGRYRAAHLLRHPVPVRSVGCSPVAAGSVYWAVTGADDGKVRMWDVTNPDRLPTQPKELADAHTAAVQFVSFSPDGLYFATAAGKDVFVWDAREGKKLYALPVDHRDTITCAQFTPQCTLVTAAKDRTLKVWKLGKERGVCVHTIDHRAGAVDVLGVSRDGGRVLFDQDKGRLDLVSLSERQTVGQVLNPGSTASFSTVALFSPDDSFLVTGGGDGELKGGLQVWTTPASGGRGSEVARLITPGRYAITCGAFSPSKDVPFMVVGTERGTVHLWRPPTDRARKLYEGQLTNIDSTDPRYVTVRVELDNTDPTRKLLDRSAATIIVNLAR